MKKFLFYSLLVSSLLIGNLASNLAIAAEPNLDVNTPAITAIKASMTARHTQLLPHYISGAVGLTGDAFIAVKDASAVPLKDRGELQL